MTLLIFYLFLAIGVSFFCSISEAVLLSIRPSYVAAMEAKKAKSAPLLKKLTDNMDRPLAAILTANTISHTIGAAGVGAQATLVFGSEYLGIVSAILTLLILVLSEIIPKTIGATYWPQLAPSFGVLIQGLITILFPFVWLSEKLTKLLSKSDVSAFTFSRDEMQAMVKIGKEEGVLSTEEHKIASNLMKLRKLSVRSIMTPRPVIFSVPDDMSVKAYFETHSDKAFSRIPLYKSNTDDISGYVLKNDILLAQARDEFDTRVQEFQRDFVVIQDKVSAFDVFDRLMHEKRQIALVVDEYGTVQGLVTLEDVIETLIGLEITDELDTVEDMQILAKKRWEERMDAIGVDVTELKT